MLAWLSVAAVLGVSPDLEEGRLQSAKLAYARALGPLGRAAADARNKPAERVEAFDLLAHAHVALGNVVAARVAYEALLDLEPMAADPVGSPKVVDAFRQAKQGRFGPRHVSLQRLGSDPEALDVAVVNPWRLEVSYVLEERHADDAPVKRTLRESSGRVVAALKPGTRNVLTVLHPDGGTLATLGSWDQPLLGPNEKPSAPPLAIVALPETKQERRALSTPRIAMIATFAVSVAAILAGGGLYYVSTVEADDADRPGLTMQQMEAGFARARLELGLGITFAALGIAGALTSGLLFFLLN